MVARPLGKAFFLRLRNFILPPVNVIRVSSPSQRDEFPKNKWRILYSADPKSYVSLTVGRICPEIRVPPLIWSVSWGAFVPIPTFDVLVSTNRLAVPTSIFDAARNAVVGLLNPTVVEALLDAMKSI